MPSEIPLSTHLLTSEGWATEVSAVLELALARIPVMEFKPTRVGPTRCETLRLNHLATPPFGCKFKMELLTSQTYSSIALLDLLFSFILPELYY